MPTGDRPATLYRLDTDGSITTVLDNVGLSNGMGFTPDRGRMYYTDSLARKIDLVDYAVETGDITGQRGFVETPEGEGIPDGLPVGGGGVGEVDEGRGVDPVCRAQGEGRGLGVGLAELVGVDVGGGGRG